MLSRFPLKPTLALRSGDGLVLGWLFNRPWVFASEQDCESGDRLQQRLVFTMRALAVAVGMAGEAVREPLPVYRSPGLFVRPGLAMMDRRRPRFR